MQGIHLPGSYNRLAQKCTLAVCWGVGSWLVLDAQKVTAQESPSIIKPTAEKAVQFAIGSDPMPTPLELPGDPQQAKITSIKITGIVPAGESGTAELTLGESTYAFNDFGDATVAQEKPPRKLQVQMKLESRALFGLIFELTSKDLRLQTHLFLVLSSIPDNPSQLIIGDPRRSSLTQGGEETSIQPDVIVELHSITNSNPPLTAPQPLRKNIHVSSSLVATGDTTGSKLGSIELLGTLNGAASLIYDRNVLLYEWQADRASFGVTQMGFLPQPLQLKGLNVRDATGQGRQLYQLVFEKPFQLGDLTLVTQPEARAPHRLIIRQAGAIKWVLRMHCHGIRQWEELQLAAQQLPEAERRTIQKLSDTVPYNFFCNYRILEGHVAAVDLYGEATSGESLAILPAFTQLRFLYVMTPHSQTAGSAAMVDLDSKNAIEEAIQELSERLPQCKVLIDGEAYHHK